MKIAERKFEKGYAVSPEHTSDIKDFVSYIKTYLQYSQNNLLQSPKEADIISMNEKAAQLRNDFNKKAMARMNKGEVKVEMLSINTNNELRGIADQLTHVMHASEKLVTS